MSQQLNKNLFVLNLKKKTTLYHLLQMFNSNNIKM